MFLDRAEDVYTTWIKSCSSGLPASTLLAGETRVNDEAVVTELMESVEDWREE